MVVPGGTLGSMGGAVAYLGFDMLVLQSAFVAIDVHSFPSFAVISMCCLIGGLAGSIPLPANLGPSPEWPGYRTVTARRATATSEAHASTRPLRMA